MEFDYSEDLKNRISDNILSVKKSIEDVPASYQRRKESLENHLSIL